MPSPSKIFPAVALGLALALGGCSSSTAPVGFSDPAATAADAAALDSALTASAVASFEALGGSMQLAPPVSGVVRAVSPLMVAPSTKDGYVALARQAQALKQVVPSFASAAATSVIADSLYGSVFTWDTGSDAYVRSSTTGGPANGVRLCRSTRWAWSTCWTRARAAPPCSR
jgi:hypothetical protein